MKLFLIFVAALVLDQISKIWILQVLPDTKRFFGLQYSENYGILFGISLPTGVIFRLTALILTVALGVFWSEHRKGRLNKMHETAFALIVAGGLGNMIDRIRLGFVVDFIHIGPYPNFNLADVWIVVGVMMLLWVQMRTAEHA